VSGSAPDLEDVGARAVQAALDAGMDQAEAWVERSWGLEVRVYEGAVESLSQAGSRGLGLRVITSGRPGYAYGTELTDEGVTALAQRAAGAAQVTSEDEHAGLPDHCGSAEIEGLADAGLAGWSTEQKVALAI
jgi:PmbA protein